MRKFRRFLYLHGNKWEGEASMTARRKRIVVILILLWALFPFIAQAQEIDWKKIGTQKIILFYPGVASWDFLTNLKHHKLGARNVRKGKRTCADCHFDEELLEFDLKVPDITSGKLTKKRSRDPFEPEPIKGKPPYLNLNIQAAYDNEYLYLKIDWPSNGASWNDASLADKGVPDRISIQMGKDYAPFKSYGCFVSCHDDVTSMPGAPPKDKIKAHPDYSPLERDDVRLYAYYTRKEGWAIRKDEQELKKLFGEGAGIDLWKMEFKGPKAIVEDWSIFSDRIKDKQEDVKGNGQWNRKGYSVTFKRKLQTGDPDDVQLNERDVVTIGIAVHDDKVKQRKHYVSFPLKLGIGTAGDVTAKKVQ